jgi:hypothetical protein
LCWPRNIVENWELMYANIDFSFTYCIMLFSLEYMSFTDICLSIFCASLALLIIYWKRKLIFTDKIILFQKIFALGMSNSRVLRCVPFYIAHIFTISESLSNWPSDLNKISVSFDVYQYLPQRFCSIISASCKVYCKYATQNQILRTFLKYIFDVSVIKINEVASDMKYADGRPDRYISTVTT